MKYQLFLQSRSAECGLACAAMILRRLGIDTDLHRLRTQYEVGRDGMSTTAIRFLLLDFNVPSFQHKGRVRVIGEALKQGKQVMVHVDGDHFCLVESVDSRWVRLADPGRGRVKMSREDAIRKIKRFLEDEESLSKASQKIMRTNIELRKQKEEEEAAQ